LLLCFLLVILTTQSSSACTYLYDPKEVTRDFSVEITDHGRGIANLHLQLEETVSANKSKHALMAITDDHGVAWFRDVRPDAYTISIKNIALSPPEDIIVRGTPTEGAVQKIAIQLPDSDVLAVRSISGSIHGQMRTNDPVNYLELVDFGAGVKLTLILARSEKVVESHVADESGGFSFSALPEGLYFLHVEAPAEPAAHRRDLSEYIPITVDPSAKMCNLNLRMSPGICVAFAYRNGDEN
jgi:hypothetical protein